jgi:uncharacterized RDD family membrane protein YckC
VRCPRCQEETDAPAGSRACLACGAPLALPDEPPLRQLDVSLTLDRRGPRGPVDRDPGATPPGLPAALPEPKLADRREELAALERSDWDLRPVLGGAALEPAAPPPSAVPPPRPAPAPTPAARGPRAPAAPALVELPDADVDAVEVRVRRASTARRVGAWIVDGAPFAAAGTWLASSLLGAARAGLPAPPTGIDGALDLLAHEQVIVLSSAATVALALAVYATLAHALAGATLGKWILGIRVVGPDGARPSLARSAARSALAVVSAALLGLGFLLALFTRSGRALHDLVARTWVVDAP